MRDISGKVQTFWSEKWDKNWFYCFGTAACIFPSKACLERCCFQKPLSSPKKHLLNWRFRIYVSNLSKWVWSDTKSVILKTFSLTSRLFLINGNTWCAVQGDRQPKSQEEQPEKYTNTKRHWLKINANVFHGIAYPILPEPFKIVEACYVDFDSECHLIAGDSQRWPFKDCWGFPWNCFEIFLAIEFLPSLNNSQIIQVREATPKNW